MRSLVKMLMVVLFLGWIFVWIMISTNRFQNIWTPKLAKYLKTTYFGPQGINFSIYSRIKILIPSSLSIPLSCTCRHESCATHGSNDVHCGSELCLFAYPKATLPNSKVPLVIIQLLLTIYICKICYKIITILFV